ncbi:MAG: hypothetical protein H0T09_01665 [Actinobacteria bacterium]|nr:hypothetical protein [Actinomycetota bacterium]
MKRLAALSCVLLASATLLGLAGGAAGSPPDGLRIVVWPKGKAKGGARVFTLRCEGGRSSHPQPERACRALAGLEAPFRPIPVGAACTQQYGGPQEALVTGYHRGLRVWTWFRRSDGCEITRWNRVRFLFPVPLGSRSFASS